MSMERVRRDRFSNTTPTAGEFAIVFVLAGVLVFLITPLLVQGIVGRMTAGQFAWPNNRVLDAYGGLLQGHFGAGLARGVADELPADAVMCVFTVVGEVLTLGATVVVAQRMRDVTGAGSRHGLATATQAAEALGVAPLRARASQIRPDLYARSSRKRFRR